MKQEAMHGDIGRLQRLHRLRRIVAWVALVVLGLALTSVAYAATRGTSAQRSGEHLADVRVTAHAIEAVRSGVPGNRHAIN